MPSSMLLLNWIRSLHSPQAFASFTFLARKRCFSGGTDTSRRLLRPCGTHRALPDGDRRKKRGIDFATQKHTGICPYGVRFQRIKHRIGEPGAIQRSLTLKMRFKSLAAARNWVRENPETRPATSPRAPAAATPFLYPPILRHKCLSSPTACITAGGCEDFVAPWRALGITPLPILRSTRRFDSPRGAGFQARNADILVGASGRAPILVAAMPLCGAGNFARSRL